MGENSLSKYDGRELDRIGNSIAITNKLLSSKNPLVLIIDETSTTPYINFNASIGIFSITGRSEPNNVDDFYEPIFTWILKNINVNNQIKFNFYFSYVDINTDNKLWDWISRSFLDFMERYGPVFLERFSFNFYYKRTDDVSALKFAQSVARWGETYKGLYNLYYE